MMLDFFNDVIFFATLEDVYPKTISQLDWQLPEQKIYHNKVVKSDIFCSVHQTTVHTTEAGGVFWPKEWIIHLQATMAVLNILMALLPSSVCLDSSL